MTSRSRFLIPVGATVALFACDRPPVVRNCDFSGDSAVPCPNLNDPAGRVEGTVIYQGPPPPESPSRPGVPSGRIVLLLFEYDNPPPPQGTATSALSFQTISAAQAFQSSTALPDGSVRATIPFMFPGITKAGEYQIRAFYSPSEAVTYQARDGHEITRPSGFHPLYGVRQLPIAGDVGGGAIVDPTAAIPKFARIVIGASDGVDPVTMRPKYRLPDEGFVASNVTVFIGSTFQTDRPMFSVYLGSETRMVQTPSGPARLDPPLRMRVDQNTGAPGTNGDRAAVPAPSFDLLAHANETGLLPTGSPILRMERNLAITDGDTGRDVPSFSIQLSLPNPSVPHWTVGDLDECEIAAIAGVRCPRDPFASVGFFESALDLDEDGVIEFTAAGNFADANPSLITTNPLARGSNGRLPWIYPLVILSKLHDPTYEEAVLLARGENGMLSREAYERLRTALNQPEGFHPELTLPDGTPDPRYPVLMFGSVVPGGSAAQLLVRPWGTGYHQAEAYARVAVVPLAVQVRGPDQRRDWVAYVPPGDPRLIAAAAPFLPDHVVCEPWDPLYADADPSQLTGIPAGRYAINLIGPGGQAWTLPNELGGFTTNAPDSTVCLGIAGGTSGICAAPSQALILRVRDTIAPPAGSICPSDLPRP